jgi:hypothetical protein
MRCRCCFHIVADPIDDGHILRQNEVQTAGVIYVGVARPCLNRHTAAAWELENQITIAIRHRDFVLLETVHFFFSVVVGYTFLLYEGT